MSALQHILSSPAGIATAIIVGAMIVGVAGLATWFYVKSSNANSHEA